MAHDHPKHSTFNLGTPMPHRDRGSPFHSLDAQQEHGGSVDAKFWFIGLTFSVLGGWPVTWLFLKLLRKAMRLPEKPKPKGKNAPRGVPAILTGMIERLFFTVLVAFNVAGVAVAMIAWIALKLATNWNRNYWKKTSSARLYGFSALLAGLVSMLFAFLGGLIARGELWADLASCI